MGEFFNLDNKWVQGLGKLVDCVCLSLIWLACCLPAGMTFYVAWQSPTVVWGWLICWVLSILIGPATTALYYTVNKVIRHNRGYIWREFWHAFKTNFKQSAIVGLIMFALCLFFWLDCYIMYQFAQAGEQSGSLYVVFIVFIALALAWGCYLFPYIARFENTTKQAVKNAGLIALANLPWTVVVLVLLCAVCLAVYVMPLAAFIAPAFYMIVVNYILEKIFKKYMSEEDIAAEEERNQEFYN